MKKGNRERKKPLSVNGTNTKMRTTSSSIKDSWMAAAQILKNNGYVCTGTLMQYSLNDWNYEETLLQTVRGSLFSKSFESSSAYASYKKKVRNGKNPSGIEFKSSDIKDLYLALHNVDANAKLTTCGEYNAEITDVYDFALTTSYKNVLTALVNNAAWLSQNIGVFNKINVTVATVFK